MRTLRDTLTPLMAYSTAQAAVSAPRVSRRGPPRRHRRDESSPLPACAWPRRSGVSRSA